MKEDAAAPAVAPGASNTQTTTNKMINNYMWYIHILVKVNTEARLRAKIALLLGKPVDLFTRSAYEIPTTPESTVASLAAGEATQMTVATDTTDDLMDHLVLWVFDRSILAQLVDNSPVIEQANGYARILAEIPQCFREEFCHRLYALLLRYQIVEWPSEINVPDLRVNPDFAKAVASPKSATPAASMFDIAKHPHCLQEQGKAHEGGGLDVIMGENMILQGDQPQRRPAPRTAASSAPAPSIWLGTPTASTFGDHNADMERGGYFGTVDNPMPLSVCGNWKRSRNGFGPGTASVGVHQDGEHSVQQQPFSSPMQRYVTPTPARGAFQDSAQCPPQQHFDSRRQEIQPGAGWLDGAHRDSTSAIQQQQMDGEDEQSRRPSSINVESGSVGGCMPWVPGPVGAEAPIRRNEQRIWDWNWDGNSHVPEQHRLSSLVFGFPSSDQQAQVRQLVQAPGSQPWALTGEERRRFLGPSHGSQGAGLQSVSECEVRT